MSIEQYNIVAHDWVNLEFVINDLVGRVVGQEVHPTSSPTFADIDVTSNLTIGGDLDVTGDLVVTGTFESIGIATLADGSVTKTTAAPTTDVMIANKKYVDDEVAGALYTDEMAQDAVGGILDDGTWGNIVFTYDDENNVMYALTQDGEIDHDSLNNYDGNEHIDHTSVTFTAGLGINGGGDLSSNRTFNISKTFIEVIGC